jgi:hypothetical protein
VLTWLAVPFLFTSAVLGLSALAGVLVGAVGWTIALSSPVFGAATAVTAAISGTVAWTRRWQRAWLRWPYLVAVFITGILLDGVQVPVVGVVAIGLPITGLLVMQFFVERRRSEAHAERSRPPYVSTTNSR